MIDAALAYAEHGVPVFPLTQAKKPIPKRDPDPSGKFKDGIPGTGGFYKATTDRATIEAWWRKTPDALIGIPMGERTGVWALDVDAPGDHADGVGALEKLCADHGALPATRQHASGTGGVHYFFDWRETAPIRCSRGVIPKGIDIKGTGGYVVVPPSVRKKRGPYVVASDVPIVDPPGWLIEAIFEKKPRPKKEPGEDREPRGDVDEKTVAKAMEFIANDNAPWGFLEHHRHGPLCVVARREGLRAVRRMVEEIDQIRWCRDTRALGSLCVVAADAIVDRNHLSSRPTWRLETYDLHHAGNFQDGGAGSGSFDRGGRGDLSARRDAGAAGA
jgi:hypothetical protein